MPTTDTARQWLDRWDRQQEQYNADREERFAVVADVVEAAVGEAPVVVDLGAGPGSTSARLLDRLPAATVFAVDADPLLLGLARAAYADRPRLRLVEHDLRDPAWPAAVGVQEPVDAIVSTTALHWLTREELGAVYDACARLLRSGGVLVDGDHLAEGPRRPRLDAVAERVATARAERVGVPRAEDWADWWAAVDVAPELADLRAGREARPVQHDVAEPATYDDHLRLLHQAGFAEVGTVWQQGQDRVLVAIR